MTSKRTREPDGMKYIAFLAPQATGYMRAVLGENGSINAIPDTHVLLAELADRSSDCLVLDPAFITPDVANAIVAALARHPRPVVAFSSVSPAALASSIILAQLTSARFIFRGTTNERWELERAILLVPDAVFSTTLVSRLDTNLVLLPHGIRDRLVAMFRTGDGPDSPDALSAAVGFPRRSLDRHLAGAGFVSARAIVEAAHLASAYRVITRSRIPLTTIASLLGYKSHRTMDAQLTLLMDTTAGQLRDDRPDIADAAEVLARKLTDREGHERANMTRNSTEHARPPLTLIQGRPRRRYMQINPSGDRVTKS